VNIFAKVEGESYQFDRPEIDSRGFVIHSWAKFCPICLRGWAHMTAVVDMRLKSNHSVRGQLCGNPCGRQSQLACVPGSLLEEPQTNCQTLDWDLLDYLPRELLLREFLLHEQFINKQDPKPNELTAATRDYFNFIASNVGPERL
jgi:hypothetical protein